MVGALLHHDVAGLHMHFGIIQQHVDLALQHEGVVDAFRAVGEGVAGGFAAVAVVDAHFLQHGLIADAAGVACGRKIHHAQDRALGRRRHRRGPVGAVRIAGDVDRRFLGHPEQGGDEAGGGAHALVGRGAVDDDHGLAGLVMAGDDAPDGFGECRVGHGGAHFKSRVASVISSSTLIMRGSNSCS